MAAHEAMQAGLPVISSAVGELTRSVQPGVTGWTVPPRNTEALSACLAQALARPETLHQMGQAARSYVFSHFNEDAFTKAGQAVLARLAQIAP